MAKISAPRQIYREEKALQNVCSSLIATRSADRNQSVGQYNYIRPHHALGMRPSVTETLLEKRPLSGTFQGGQTNRS